jgi:uncharacterized damage-inducible protein DinB
MSLTTEQAKTLCEVYLADIQTEAAITKKVLAAVPADKSAYAPSEKCMTAIKLCNHITGTDVSFLNGVANGAFVRETMSEPNAATPAEVITWYDANLPAAIARVKAMSADDLAKEIDFFGFMKLPAVTFLSLNVRHNVHHRGQLSSYLRPMGAKVPGIYGPSGDSQ